MSRNAFRPGRWLGVPGAWCAAFCVVACAGSNLEGRVFSNDELSFRLGPTPPAWRLIDEDGELVTFRDDETPASIAVNGRCGKDGDDVPLEALTHHLFIQFTDRQIENQVRVQLDGRAALHTELTAKLDGVEKRFDVFVLKKNGCVYDLVYVTPPSAPSGGQKQFLAFVEGFATIRP
jgi:hypothetical protein